MPQGILLSCCDNMKNTAFRQKVGPTVACFHDESFSLLEIASNIVHSDRFSNYFQKV